MKIFGPIWAILEVLLTEKEKNAQNGKVVSHRYLPAVWPPFFFNFQSGKALKLQKNTKRNKKGTKLACTVSCAVCAHRNVQWPGQFQTA